ncbi:MAG: hypothetical protein AUG51_22115 [Acidobacteria bacterium 13_1_20CM_3_53_8]|nr:MAG: hypothetical protein AUG51_22115 [Acidobacteria bacterium 13_1_20CM_3_53_8]
MTRGQPPNGWYTAKEARGKLGNITDGKLRTLIGIGEGKIERMEPPGAKQGFYKASDVHKIARAWNKEAMGKQHINTPIKFRRMEIEEMVVVADILEKLFETHPNIPQWQDRIRANPEIGFVVTDDGVIVGCGFIMPHTEEKILSILPHEATPITFPHEILPYEPGNQICLYLRSVGVHQNDVPIEKKRRWAQVLIIGILKEIVKLGSRGITVDKVYARSDTFQGERMMHRLGFTRLTTTTSHENFVVDIESSGLSFAKQYKAALSKWRIKHEGA